VGRLAVALLVALSAFLIASGAPLGPWLDRVSGAEPRAIFDVTLPADADAKAVEATWRARLEDRLREIAWSGDTAVVTVAGDRTHAEATATAEALSGTATLEVREVRADTPTMRAVFAALGGRDGDVSADVDSWRDEMSGQSHADYFVYGPSREAVEAAIAEVLANGSAPPLADDEAFVYETFVPPSDAADRRPFVRSYVVGGDAVITGADVANAVVIWDPQSNRPEVLVELTEDGTRRFGDATSRHVGDKLAIIVDGHVTSAPVIMRPITGGRTKISMGSGSPDAQQLEADRLVATLRGGPRLPPGIRAQLRELVAPSPEKTWAARAAVTLLAGTLAWVLAMLIARETTAAPQVVPTRRGGARDLAVAVGVTVLGVAVIEYLAGVFLPGLSLSFRDLVDREVHVDDPRRIASPVALGTVPIVAAYLLVELVAWAIPALRARRVGTSRDRAPLELAVAILAFGLALAQSYITLKWFRVAPSDDGLPALDEGALVQVGIVASLLGGVALHAVIAQLITRHGLCNGWLVLVAYDLLRRQPHEAVLAGLVILGAVIAVGLTARRATAPDARRLPVSGLAPAALIPTIVGLLALPYVSSLWHDDAVMRLLGKPIVQIGFACGVATLLSLRRGTPATVAVVTAIAMSAIIAAFPYAFPALGFREPLLAGAIGGVLCAELAQGARRRLLAADAIALVTIHDVERADEYVDLLRNQHIPAFPTGARARGLYRGLGPFVPVTIHVPRERAEEAAKLLRLP
jgi:hypothetical protein